MNRRKTIQERFESVSGQIASAMRTTLSKYKSLTETLRDVQRGIETSQSVCRSLFKAIDGPCWEILALDPKYRTEEFVQRLYDALTNTSIRKWTRAQLALVNETKKQLEGVSRKAVKLKERFDADPHATEAKATAVLLKRMLETKEALMHRIEFTVRKFLEVRLCILKTLTGTSEMLFLAANGIVTRDLFEEFSTVTKKECDSIVQSDDYAVRNGRKRQ